MTNQIEVNKYEGRSKRRAWRTSWGAPYSELYLLKENDECNEVDVDVLADAPLLLEEVIQLRKQLGAYMRFQLWVQEEYNEIHDSYEDVDEL